jgi:hypothetical protein
MIVDFMLTCLNLGYHDENWKARMESGVETGKVVCGRTVVGILREKRAKNLFPSSDLTLCR